MKKTLASSLVLTLLAAAGCEADRSARTSSMDGDTPGRTTAAANGARMNGQRWDRDAVTKHIAGWGEEQRAGAQMMMDKYGPPQGVDPERLTWYDAGPFKRIELTRKADPHDFPYAHNDFLEHVVAYRVDPEHLDQLSAFDGSANADRTRGELRGRCDLEAHNILTLNVAHEVLSGNLGAEEAKEQFAQEAIADMSGRPTDWVTGLRFTAARMEGAPDADEVFVPGGPARDESRLAWTEGESEGSRAAAEALGVLAAIDVNEIIAAKHALTEDIGGPVRDYAQMLYTQHGRHLTETTTLAQSINASPLMARDAMELRKKGSADLAKIIPLEGREFERAYIDAMVKGHADAVQKIDTLLRANHAPPVRQHLERTRSAVAMHLEEARRLQNEQR